MANAKKCDRCKSFFDKDTTFVKKAPNGSISKFDYTQVGIEYEKSRNFCNLDLCPKCAENLYEWLLCCDKLKD